MPKRRSIIRRAGAGILGVAGSAAIRLVGRAARRPVDSLAILGASAASLVIAANALFLQSGSHPAPFFANPPPPSAARAPMTAAPVPPPMAADSTGTAHASAPVHKSDKAVPRRNDPIADMIASSIGSPKRVLAVQQVLSAYGYGQVKPSGTLDRPTSAAIEKFERDHKLPPTGRLSERLLQELAALAGHPIE